MPKLMTRKKILIIEDDQTLQEMLKMIFEKAGYDIEISCDGQSIYKDREVWPDLFLLDKQLFGFDGLDICRYLKTKESTSRIPVLMVSATPGIEPMALDAGADDFLEKPFNTAHLMSKIARLLQ